MRIDAMRVAVGSVDLPTGRSYTTPPNPATQPRGKPRHLNSAGIRRTLPPKPQITRDWTLVVHTDLSPSMTGGNDATGLRHEALLIVAEHLAAARRTAQQISWHLRVHSFDDGGTCVDLDRTPIDRLNVRHLETALLGETYGGSSNLGPSLSTSIAETPKWPDTGVIRFVLSDFELMDRDVAAVLDRYVSAPADLNVAIVFRSPVPHALKGTSVRTHHVDPNIDAPEVVATLMMDAIVSGVLAPSGDARPIGRRSRSGGRSRQAPKSSRRMD